MVDCVINDTERTSEGSEKIIAWLSSDTDKTPSASHDNIIIALFREVLINDNLQYLNSNRVLGNLAIEAFDRQNPGFIKKQLEKILEKLKSSPMEPDNKIMH